MAPMMIAAVGMQVAGAAVSAAGTIAGGNAAAAAGRYAKDASEFTALQQEQAAQNSRAEWQRGALEKRREGRLLQSKLVARAAASGGGADDPDVIDIGSDIAGRAEEMALMEMFHGENRARGLEDQALATRRAGDAALFEGEAKKKAAKLQAIGTIIGAGGSAFGTYAGGGRSAAPAATPAYG